MTLQFEEQLPLSLYIHIPWCIKKCPYCDFNSHEIKNNFSELDYIEALKLDLEQSSKNLEQVRLKSIFFGGGTPSLFSPKSIETIIKNTKQKLPFDSNIEITLEANPGTIKDHVFMDYKNAGVNRISVGVQSFNDSNLSNLGRIHNVSQIYNNLEQIIQAGFDNFNIDLMFGLPSQTVENALNDLEQAIKSNPPHLSWYQLTLEPNTYFFNKPPNLPKDDLIWGMQQRGTKLLSANNYNHYEVSAFAKPNKQCQHNLNYWTFGDYLGIGAGAHSKLTDFSNNKITRITKFKHPKDYLNITKGFNSKISNINKIDIPFEFMLNALRLNNGFCLSLFEQRTGLPLNTIQDVLNIAKEKEFINIKNNYLHITKHGMRFLNDLTILFLDTAT